MLEENHLTSEQVENIFKALSNDTRLKIIHLLKEPEKNFPKQNHRTIVADFYGGVCVGAIQDKINLSQSTTSHYLSLLQTSGLLETKRIGQWTYYRRNEVMLKTIASFLTEKL